MVTFILCILFLVGGYLLYGRYVARVFGPDDRPTPAIAINDGVDYVPMPTWKVFLIELLNIAGTGPIFGALSGALFGPIAFLWIILGNVFGGAVHDYMAGMISIRNNGASLSEITGKYLGKSMKTVMRFFSVILMVMCGVVFTNGPAELLAMLTPKSLDTSFWFWVIVIYYFIATFVPIDKVIGKLYPVFGACLIIMAVGVSGSMLFSHNSEMPELWNNFSNMHASGTPVWPFMFITIACGAVSGFHATQAPMMARCCKSEKLGLRVFYGAMIAEGIIALVWCAAGLTFYEDSQALLEAGAGVSSVVYYICQTAMGKIGMVIAMIGVVVCPISSGDTAYRSARLTLADWLKFDQSSVKNRIILTVPLLLSGTIICKLDYSMVWRYFSWSNQTLAMITLWAAAVYLFREKKNHWICVFPATFMSAVSASYFLAAPECMGALWETLGVEFDVYYPVAIINGLVFASLFLFIYLKKTLLGKKQNRYIKNAKDTP